MCSLVSFQAVGTQEALVTLVAGVWSNSGVVTQMDGKVARLSELLATVGTLKGLVACMESFVLQKLGVGEETLPTIGAEVRPLT